MTGLLLQYVSCAACLENIIFELKKIENMIYAVLMSLYEAQPTIAPSHAVGLFRINIHMLIAFLLLLTILQ